MYPRLPSTLLVAFYVSMFRSARRPMDLDGRLPRPQLKAKAKSQPRQSCSTSIIKGPMVSIRWYLGFLKGQLGGAGMRSTFELVLVFWLRNLV